MSKAEDFDRRMRERPLARPGVDFPIWPEVRIRDDAPSMEIDEATVTKSAIERLANTPHGLVLRDETGEPAVVMVSPERYAELATAEIYGADPGGEGYWLLEALPGRFESEYKPAESVLKALMIEKVDPGVKWEDDACLWPPKPYHTQYEAWRSRQS